MYVFCTDQQPDPVTLNYKLIYSTFERKPHNDVDQFHIANYIRQVYNIPFTFIRIFLRKYINIDTGEVKEENFLELMKELNSTNILDIPNRISLFETYDIYKNYYIKGEDLVRIFYETNKCVISRQKIIDVISKLKIKPSYRIDFLDFLKIINEFYAEELEEH